MFKKWSLFHQQIVYKNACHPDVADLLFSNESEENINTKKQQRHGCGDGQRRRRTFI